MAEWQLGLLALVGIVAGFLNVLAGGGSLLTLPAMIFLGLPPATANGTNRIAILAQNGAAVAGFRRHGFSDFPLSLRLSAFGAPGAVAGAVVAVRLDPAWFQRLLAVIMIGVLATILWPKRRPAGSGAPAGRDGTGGSGGSARSGAPDGSGGPAGSGGSTGSAGSSGESGARQPAVAATRGGSRPGTARTAWAYAAMVGAGFYVGFIQAGVGFILMAVLHSLLRLDLVRVNMHKVFIVGLFTLPAFVVFIAEGQIEWTAGVLLAAGNAFGGWIGSRVAVERGERVIRLVFGVTVLATAVKLLLG